MAVNLKRPLNKNLSSVPGISLGITSAGLKNKNQKDLLLILLPKNSIVSGVFTQNKFCAAPVMVAKNNIKTTKAIRALIVNTGSANAGTGKNGLKDAKDICNYLALQLNIKPNQVLPFSTGLIMTPLPVQKIKNSIFSLLKNLKENNWLLASKAIMTTDTIPKAISTNLKIDKNLIHITGISKGSGMIHPEMATMLAFIGTDVNISKKMLNQLIKEVTQVTFNCISVDGDTSTNDSFVIMSTSNAKNNEIKKDNKDYKRLKSTILEVANNLAQSIIRDGEGATKFISIDIRGANSLDEARKVGMAIACSPLVKTAFFASDANLGRVLSAIGNSKVSNLDVSKIKISLNNIIFAEKGSLAKAYNEIKIKKEMKKSEINLKIFLNRGRAELVTWTSDLSHDYVKINAEYRT